MKELESSQYKHIKSGKLYTVLGIIINATNSNDGQKMVLYAGSDLFGTHRLFVRDKTEFFEKFVCVIDNKFKDL